MTPEIRTEPIDVLLIGASSRHDPARSFGEEIIGLLNRVWPVLKNYPVPSKGINWVAYEADCGLFAGVELAAADPGPAGLESRRICIQRHAWWKHVGPYSKLGEVNAAMRQSLAARGLRMGCPSLEIYGHWNEDESKLETEIVYPLIP